MPSLWCLISALTQAGGGDLLFRFASSVQSCCGECEALQADITVWGGALAVFRPHWVCPVQGCLSFPRLHCSGSRLLYMELALRCVRFQFPTKAWIRLCLRVVSSPASAAQAARGLVPSPRARCAFSLRGPSALRRSGLRKSSDRTRGLFAGWEGVASLGLSLPLSPAPAPYLQRGWAGSSLEFLSPCVLRTAGGVFRLVSSSLGLPQFKKISLRLLSGPSGRSPP